MTRPRPRIGSELLPLFLILACLGGTLTLVIAMHRRAAESRLVAEVPKATPVVVPPPPEPQTEPEPEPEPAPPPSLPPPEDPTKKALAQLASLTAEQVLETQKADKRAETLEAARKKALAESERWRRREVLVRSQIDALTEKARQKQIELDSVAMERDALAKERDAAKAALAKARTSSSYSILPHKGPNGTWRRPLIIECRNGTVTIQPNGSTFTLLELARSGLGVRSNPFIMAVARELIRIGALSSPDGAPSVPYIFFVIRPDGIRPYYEARGRLEMLGIAFGYELVDQDWEIDFSEPDEPLNVDSIVANRSSASPPAVSDKAELGWPGDRSGGRRSNQGDSPDSFVWPVRPTGVPEGGSGAIGSGGRSGPAGTGSGGGSLVGGMGGNSSRSSGGVGSFVQGSGDVAGDSGVGGGGPPPFGGIGSNNGAGGGLVFEAPGSSPSSIGGAPPSGGGNPALVPFGPPGGTTATERVFGTPAGLTEVNPDGLPTLEATGGSGGRADQNVLPGNPSGRTSNSAPNRSSGGAPFGGLGAKPPAVTPNSGLSGVLAELANPGAGDKSNLDRIPIIPGASEPFVFDKPEDENDSAGNSSGGSGNAGNASGGGRTGRSSSATTAGGGSSSSTNSELPSPSSTPGSVGSPAGSTGTPSPFMNLSGSAPQQSDSTSQPPPPPRNAHSREIPRTRVEVPFDITVVCGPNGLILYPGGYRLSPKALATKDGMLVKELKGILEQRRQVDPLIIPRPSLKFLVERGGMKTYQDARRQTLLSGINWPLSIQFGETNLISLSGQETRR